MNLVVLKILINILEFSNWIIHFAPVGECKKKVYSRGCHELATNSAFTEKDAMQLQRRHEEMGAADDFDTLKVCL